MSFPSQSRQSMVLCLVLSFQAGWINTGGFLACHRFVTHTTGFATMFGVELVSRNIATAIGMLSVPLFFLCGAMISAFFIDRNLQFPSQDKNEDFEGRAPDFSSVFFLMMLTLAIVCAAGLLGKFGQFGEPLALTRDYILLSLLCLTSGLQNALVTTAYGGVVRTTHLTGLTTDLGIGIVRVLFPKSEMKKNLEIKANTLRLLIIGHFILGSTLAGFLFVMVEYAGFLIPLIISTSLFFMSLIQLRPRQLKETL